MGSGPNFSDLGVIDPTTGQPVHLSSGDIANVMGATGGVAPTQFQAGVQGFFKGVGQGQEIVGNISNIQAQQSRIAYTDAETEAQNIQNEIARQTQQATITAKNNQVKQQAIQSQIQTEKLEADNAVLDAVRSADPVALTKVITDPKTMLSAIELEKEVQAGFGKLRASGVVTPQQQADFDTFKRTVAVFKNGDTQAAYDAAGRAVQGIPEVQVLQQQSGLPMSQLLAQMTVAQSPRGIDPATGQPSMDEGGTVLVAPNGKKVLLPAKDADTSNKLLTPFFSARQAMLDPGPLKSPMSYPPAAPPAQAAEAPSTTSALPAATPTTPPVATAETSVAAQTPVNPNAIGPTGVPIQTNIPQLSALNTKTTPTGNPLSRAISTRAQELFSTNPGMTPSQAYNQANKEIIKKAPSTAKAKDATSDTVTLAENKRLLADKIDFAVTEAERIGYSLGPNWGDTAGRAGANITSLGQSIDATVSGTPEDNSLRNVKSSLASAQSMYTIQTAASSGMGTKMYDSDKNQEMLQAQGPGILMSPDENRAVATRLRGEAKALDDENTIAQTLDTIGIDFGQVSDFVKRYHQENPTLIFDQVTGKVMLNPTREDPTRWTYKKLGVDPDQAAKEAFTAPATLPKAAPSEVPAPGSEQANVFGVPKKTDVSAFVATEEDPKLKGAGYNETPTNMKDIRAIAETATAGKSVKQFQQSGSVPFKLDKATPDLVARVIGAEALPKGGGAVDVNSVSPTGVKGVMQVTQATFKEQASGAAIPLTNREDPLQSIVAGTQYLNSMLKKYDGNVDLALAAYNAGPGTVDGILESRGLSTNRTTIDMIADDLPKTQPTADYVKTITSRGRVGASSERSKGKGFFDNFSIQSLNPFSVASAEAEELPSKATDLGIIRPEGVAPKPGDDPQGTVEGGGAPPTQFGAEEALQLPTGGPVPDGISEGAPTAQAPNPTTATAAKVEPMDNSPRNGVPPVSEIQAALVNVDMSPSAVAKRDMRGAVEFVRNSPVGKFLGSLQGTYPVEIVTNMVNAATFGLYDEGIGLVGDSLGLDGDLLKKQVREDLTEFRKTNPKAALVSDIIGSVAGGWGAGVMLRALKGGAAVASTVARTSAIEPLTVRTGAKIAASQGAARGFGEGESVGGRVIGAGIGGTAGAVLGGGATALSKIPVAGAPAMLGAGLGAVEGAMRGGDASTMAQDATLGAAALSGAAVANKYSPVIQKAIASAIVHLNNYKGSKALLSLIQSIMTGKTPAETAANLSDDAAAMAKLLSNTPRKTVEGWIDEMVAAGENNPQIPIGFSDIADDVNAKALVKQINQIAEYPTVTQQTVRFYQSRGAGQNARIEEQVGPPELVEQTATKLLNRIEGKVKGARGAAITATEDIYSAAEKATPVLRSPEINRLLATNIMKKAIAAAKEDLIAPLDKGAKQAAVAKHIQDLSKIMAQRRRAGQPIDDLLQETMGIPDNSLKVLHLARTKLDDLAEATTNPKLSKDIYKIKEDLTAEMVKLSKPWAEAQAKYSGEMAKVDVLTKSTQVDAIRALAGGNVRLAITKVMNMAPKELQDFMAALDDPEAFKDVARSFIIQKLDKARGSGDIASKLMSKGERRTLETLFGPEEAKKFMEMADLESKVAKSSAAMKGGSDTVPKAMAQTTLDEYAGKNKTVAQNIADVTAGSKMAILARGVRKVLNLVVPKGDPKRVQELADILILSAPKGIKAMQDVLRARGLADAEIAELGPYMQQWQTAAHEAGVGIGTSIIGQASATSASRKRKKK